MPRKKERPAGSSAVGEPAFLAVGRVRRPHGVKGEVLVEAYTQFPENLKPGMLLTVGKTFSPLKLRGVRSHKKGLLLSFESIQDPEVAGRLRNEILYIPSEDRPALPEGEYYYHQLIGLNVIDGQEGLLGQLCDILATGANDVYVIKGVGDNEILLPAIREVVQSVDLQKGEMHVRLLPGLLEVDE